LLRNSGLLRREHGDRLDTAYQLYRSRRPDTHPREREAVLFRRTFAHEAPIHFIGVWDSVGALGVPIQITGLINRRLQFHDTELSSKIRFAYQALAIDERRRFFSPALWTTKAPAADQTLEQVWFIGAHSNVGGGYPDQGLSDLASLWMAEKAQACGLALALSELKASPDRRRPPDDSRKGLYRLLPAVWRAIGADESGRESLHESVVRRYLEDPRYRPRNLESYLQAHPEALANGREESEEGESRAAAA
jgi:hypothetical protein